MCVLLVGRHTDGLIFFYMEEIMKSKLKISETSAFSSSFN